VKPLATWLILFVLLLLTALLVSHSITLPQSFPTMSWQAPELLPEQATPTRLSDETGWWNALPTPVPVYRSPTATITATVTRTPRP